MESFGFNLQTEKGNATLKHLKLVTILLRLVEVCVVLVLISMLSMKLPVAVRNSSEYLKDFSVFNSHYFVFLIGNIIIIALFAQGYGRNVPNEQEYDDIYEKLVRKSIKHEEKEKIKIRKDGSKVEKGDSVEEQKMKRGVKKSYRRCGSGNLKKQYRVLRRCESENNGRKSIEPAHVAEEEMIVRILYPEDKMSNEEFRRTVEAFIAKNRGFEG